MVEGGACVGESEAATHHNASHAGDHVQRGGGVKVLRRGTVEVSICRNSHQELL
jgi:hypothetical protein